MISTKTTKSNETGTSNRARAPKRHGASMKKVTATHLGKRARRRMRAEAPQTPRKESKQQICLALLSRPEGASMEELQKSTGWQPHSVRGFLAGAVKRKLGLALTSEKAEGQPRRYRIPQATA
jgi:hypothetical protein